jgi:Na+-transporting NADH:ubiquinone oxidoreductase subunit C
MAKLNTNSNAYIIIYSAILVVIVAFLLGNVVKSPLKGLVSFERLKN